MSSRQVCISLDDESYLLWMKLPQKSKWVRVKLQEEMFESDLIYHAQSEQARAEGKWDGRCNPNSYNKGICTNCWAPDDLRDLSVDPQTKLYISPTLVPPKSAMKKFLEQKGVVRFQKDSTIDF